MAEETIAGAVQAFLDDIARGDTARLDTVLDAWAGRDTATLERLLAPEERARLDEMAPRLERAAQTARGGAALGETLDAASGRMVRAWAEGAATRPTVVMAPLFEAASHRVPERFFEAPARARVAHGPILDALRCLGHTGGGAWLREDPAARARIDLLVWEAGASALSVPELGAWLWRDPTAQAELVYTPARGTLRARVLAARTLAVAADGIPAEGVAVASVARSVRTARALASHPEGIVWIPAARALGRLAARVPSTRLTLLRWLESDRVWERRRTVTALASVPGPHGDWIERNTDELLASDDPWRIAALGPALPYLVRERPDLWEALAAHLTGGSVGAPVLWSVTQGLAALIRREPATGIALRVLRHARDRALAGAQAAGKSVTDAQLWQIIRRDTDALDGIDPDPAFPDVLLDRAARDAVRLGAGAVVQRAKTIARTIPATFDASLRTVSTTGDTGERGYALASVEACARAAALDLPAVIAAAAGRDPEVTGREVAAARRHMSEVFAGYLGVDQLDFPLRRAALRALGNDIDAAPPGEQSRVAAYALSALATSQWAQGVRRSQMVRFRKPVTDLLWRVADSLSGASGSIGDTVTLGPLAAWWALCVGGAQLTQLMQADSPAEQERIAGAVAEIRAASEDAEAGATIAATGARVREALRDLGAADTMLAYAVDVLFSAFEAAEEALASRTPDDLDYALEYVAEPIALLAVMAGDPALALARASGEQAGVSEVERMSLDEARAWPHKLGPALRPIAVDVLGRVLDKKRAVDRASADARRIGPYQKIRRLGGGGQGEVWLVRREGRRRRYVLKTPRAPVEGRLRDKLRRVLEREAKLLEGLHEAKVATYYDYGWDGDTPFLVLQYLIGADLGRYAQVRALSIDELRPIVRDVCLGLRALHERGIVHSDLKPSNVFLRLQLPPAAGEEFAAEHRDPALARLSEAVLIDFGIARLMSDRDEETDVDGTLGYLAPEQALGEPDLTGRADVYSLAATIFTALTGRRFFQDKTTNAAYLLAHAYEPPCANAVVRDALAALPAALRELLEAATTLAPGDRPDVDAFADQFARL